MKPPTWDAYAWLLQMLFAKLFAVLFPSSPDRDGMTRVYVSRNPETPISGIDYIALIVIRKKL
jgi:hypothetical protein